MDALGTLVALADPVPRLRAALFERTGHEVSEEQVRTALGAEIAFYRAHMQQGRDTRSLAALRVRCAEVLRQALPREPRLDAITSSDLTEALLSALRFVPFPDAAPLLRSARGAGIATVVVSNWDVSLSEVLERAGLASLLDGVVTSAGAGARKPDAAPFHHALALAGADPADALHVGDSLEEDVAGARGAGIPVALLLRDRALPAPPGVDVVRRLTELRLAS